MATATQIHALSACHAVPEPVRQAAVRLHALLQWASQGHNIAVIAFHGGRGTADMVRRARAADVQVVEVSA